MCLCKGIQWRNMKKYFVEILSGQGVKLIIII